MHLMKSMLDFMPADANFIGAGHDQASNLDYLFFTSDTFKDTPDGGLIPHITPMFRTDAIIGEYVQGIDFGNAKEDDYPGVTLGTGSLWSKLNGCNHTWVDYRGINDAYDICSKCGVKK